MESEKLEITESSKSDQYITVCGKRFHYIWLRENCPNSRYPAPYQQLYDANISTRPEKPKPLSILIKDEQLVIDWDENPSYRSIFDISWLLNCAYDPQPETESESKNILWDKAWLKDHPPKQYNVHSLADESCLNQLFNLGFVILENIASEKLESFLSSIGPLRNTDYGKSFHLKARESPSSNEGCTLPPHNDLSYWQGHRVAQFIYCVKHKAIGGESLLVDGFRAARDFRQHYPDFFQILADTPVKFWLLDHKHKYFFCNTASIFELDLSGNVSTVRFSQRNCRPHLPFEQVDIFYQAYSKFFHYLKNPDYQYHFRLKPRDCLLFQNFRVLHGRTAFDSTTGSRKLKSGYLDWDFFSGRQNFKPFSVILSADSSHKRVTPKL